MCFARAQTVGPLCLRTKPAQTPCGFTLGCAWGSALKCVLRYTRKPKTHHAAPGIPIPSSVPGAAEWQYFSTAADFTDGTILFSCPPGYAAFTYKCVQRLPFASPLAPLPPGSICSATECRGIRVAVSHASCARGLRWQGTCWLCSASHHRAGFTAEAQPHAPGVNLGAQARP